MAKKYLLAIRTAEIYEFPHKKDRDEAIAEIVKVNPDVEYMTSETD